MAGRPLRRARRNGLLLEKDVTGGRSSLPSGDFAFYDHGPLPEMLGYRSGLPAYMLGGEYVLSDLAPDFLMKLGFSREEALEYLASLPSVGAGRYLP